MSNRIPKIAFWEQIPNKADWVMPIVVFFLTMVMMGIVGYFRNDSALSARVTAVEAHQGDTEKRLDRIETKVDTLGDNINTIFYYVTGIKPKPVPLPAAEQQ